MRWSRRPEFWRIRLDGFRQRNLRIGLVWMSMADPLEQDVITLERHGEVLIVVPSSGIETLRWDLAEQAAGLVLGPIREQDGALVLFDLGKVKYFGSTFLTLLLRCWKHVSLTGGMLLLCRVPPAARELLHVTGLDTLWAMYETRRQAIEILESN